MLGMLQTSGAGCTRVCDLAVDLAPVRYCVQPIKIVDSLRQSLLSLAVPHNKNYSSLVTESTALHLHAISV